MLYKIVSDRCGNHVESAEAGKRDHRRTSTRMPELVGKRLGCYCKPEACHGDVLVKLLEEACHGDCEAE